MTIYTNLNDVPRKKYALIAADPPWLHKTYSDKGQGRGPGRHYRTMTIEQIRALPVKEIAAKDCHLMLWTTQPHLEQAFDVIRDWGFKYSSVFKFWPKMRKGQDPLFWMTERDFPMTQGKTTRKTVELVLLGRKGSPKRLVKNMNDLIFEGKREHSRKPEKFYADCMRYAPGPYIELFSRQAREGWDTMGDEAELFT